MRLLRALLVLATLAAGLLAAPPADAAVPLKPPVTLPAAIEDVPSYQPQTFCDPVDKPGVVAFGTLLTTTYPDTTVVDISRGCTSESGTSEHKDGRALDWGARYDNPAQVKEVNAVFSWLFAKDATGTPNAMLRRLGIMYIIWNKKIYGTWSGSWQPYSCSGITACHQDHVHFSFDWAGALKKTSFWTGTVSGPVPPPAYVYTSRAFPQVVRVAANSAPTTTPFLVAPDVSYRFTAAGTYHYGPGKTQLADAECVTTDGTHWTPIAPGDTTTETGLFDLWIDRHRAWRPTPTNVGGCNPTTHTYVRTLTFPAREAMQLAVHDLAPTDDSGTLTVTVQRV